MTNSALAHMLGPFLDPAALAIVGGGTLLAMVLRTPARDLARAIFALRTLTRGQPFDPKPALEQIAALARIAKRHGALTLDRSVIADPDIAAAVALIVDGCSAKDVEALVISLRRARIERQTAAADVWSGAAELAPAMGMIGTLIGLVRMFVAMADPSAIGAAMAVALLATLYGALIANLIAMPIANRLRRRTRAEALARGEIEAPLVALAAQEVPRVREAVAA